VISTTFFTRQLFLTLLEKANISSPEKNADKQKWIRQMM